MRCRTHPSDHSAGVCAFCLRERLSALSVDPAEPNAKPSPAIRSPRSDFPNLSHDRGKIRAVRSSISSPIRRNPSPKKPESDSDAMALKPSVTNTKLLAIIIRQWRKNKPAVEDVTRGRSRKPHVQAGTGRGMSPATKGEAEEEDERRVSTPSRRKAQRHQSPTNKLSSYAVCLSPMWRPSPGNRRSYGASETAFGGDQQGTLNRKWSGVGVAAPDASSGIGQSRSRKLVDLGKAW